MSDKSNTEATLSLGQEDFVTSDIGMAAYLYTNSQQIVKVDRSVPQRARFFFKHTPELEKLMGEWALGSATVNAVAYANNIATMKRMAVGGI